MSNLNKVMIIGRLGRDAEIRALPNGQKVANFSLAVSEKYKDANGDQQESTTWVPIVFFGKVAEIAEKYFLKGTCLYVEAKFSVRSWDNAEGVKQYKTECIGSQFQFMGSNGDSQSSGRDKNPAGDSNQGAGQSQSLPDMNEPPF